MLRFSPADPAAITTSQPDRSQVTFRKKPPSQVQRDCKRAEEGQKATADQASVLDLSNCSMPLFMPTPPAKRTDIDSSPAEKQLADSAHVECETNARETRKKQTVVFYNCLSLTPSLTLSSMPQHRPQLSTWNTSKKKTHTTTRKQKRKSVVRDTT